MLSSVYVCKLADVEQPLFLRLLAGPDSDTLSFVLREQQTGEVVVNPPFQHLLLHNCAVHPTAAQFGVFFSFSVGRVHRPGAAELPAVPGQGGRGAAAGRDWPIRGLPPETAGGPEHARGETVEKTSR